VAVRVARIGSPRASGEGLRIGVVRRVPRGVPKSEYARRDLFDVWMPELAPSAEAVSWALSEPWTDARWRRYARRYRREMGRPAARRLIELLAGLSRQADIAIACYCADAGRCHRSLLRELLAAAGAEMR
jgi:uncharacterized protein YeaO (DUF488 family)